MAGKPQRHARAPAAAIGAAARAGRVALERDLAVVAPHGVQYLAPRKHLPDVLLLSGIRT